MNLPYKQGRVASRAGALCFSYPPDYPEEQKDDWVLGYLEENQRVGTEDERLSRDALPDLP
jgi:hypothetical protein